MARLFGEVGLGGEVRSVTSIEKRIAEAKKLGFTKALAPRTNKDEFIIGVDNVRSTMSNIYKNKRIWN